MVVTPSVWHWQERFEPVAVEDACRRQILKIRRSKSYEHWLKEKSHTSRHPREQETKDNGNQHTQAEIDAAFRDFLRRKRKQARDAKKQSVVVIHEKDNVQAKPWCKPPSLHVNPKSKKELSRKAECTPALFLRRGRSEAQNQQAYEAWLARVRLEDQVRRAQRNDELHRLEQQQREKHKITWRKKVAVCAYSTLAAEN